MPANPNKLSQFWQELKRRKVIRVITVYAAAAFVIIELVDIIAPNLGLPSWTFNLVLILLLVGFVITVIVSWIYDIHPEGGVVKTKPASKAESKGIPKSSNSWKIASYISFVVILGLIVLNIIPRAGKKEVLEKSIAILPFINDSPDQERMYFINGTMEAILDHLSKIEDLRVVSRTSVEQYRNNPKPIPVVAEEMDVSYILEGSGHRDGDNVRLYIQLLDGRKDQHLWANTYNGNIEDIFSMLSEIAQQVAGEIEAIITPEEKALIEKIPTESQTAYDLYTRAHDLEYEDPIRSEELLRMSLEYDSAYSMPYVTLGWIYWRRFENTAAEYQPAYLDSISKFIEKALFYDDQNAHAYYLSGYYHRAVGENEKAVNAFNRTLELNPNFYPAYAGKAWVAWYKNDMLEAIQNFHKAIAICRGRQLPEYYRYLNQAYLMAGFREQSDLYNKKALELDGDSAHYYSSLSNIESSFNNDPNKELDLLIKGYRIDTSDTNILIQLGMFYFYNDQYKKSLEYFEKYINQFNDLGEIPVWNKNVIALSYMKNGFTEIADTIFEQQIEYCEHRDFNYCLAQIYGLRGEKEKAIEYLKAFNQFDYMPIYYSRMSSNPGIFFKDLHNEPDFLQITKDMESKYQYLHERVRQWLEENNRGHY